jgi:hypothetical protein
VSAAQAPGADPSTANTHGNQLMTAIGISGRHRMTGRFLSLWFRQECRRGKQGGAERGEMFRHRLRSAIRC